jgi:hypothetical protein
MYPTKKKVSATTRRLSSAAAAAAATGNRTTTTTLRWLRRQLSVTPSGGDHHHTSTATTGQQGLVKKKTVKNDEDLSLPPTYLEFPQLSTDEDDYYVPPSPSGGATSNRTAPVPVGRRATRTITGVTSTTNTTRTTTTATSTTMRNKDWNDSSCSEQDFEKMDELQRMYDLRTWDMYLRITEARKYKSTTTSTSCTSSSSTMIPHSRRTAEDNTDDYDYYTPAGEESSSMDRETSEHRLDVSQSEDMIFGDLE